MKNSVNEALTPPKIGQELYIGPNDDCTGGLAKVSSVEPHTFGDRPGFYVKFQNIAHRSFNWDELIKDQEQLKTTYGDQRAKSDFGPK